MVPFILPGMLFLALSASGCTPATFSPSAGHLAAPPALVDGGIPQPVRHLLLLPIPGPDERPDVYTVTVSDVPVRELLFALARDAGLNVDIHPSVSGAVSMNAVRQSLPRILERIAVQLDLRCVRQGDSLLVLPDNPYVQTYRVDYVNFSRVSSSMVNVAARVSTTGAGGPGEGGQPGRDNNSATSIASTGNNRFWPTLTENLRALLAENRAGGAAASLVVANPENGMVTVRATSRQHEVVADFLAGVLQAARRQVLIEATVVEVQLSDQFQQGVDWQVLRNSGRGFNLVHLPQGPSPLPTGASPGGSYPGPLLFPYEGGAPVFGSGNPATFLLNYTNPVSRWGSNIAATLSLLQSFGQVKVLSSPRISVLNNQTALLKVVDNKVYFTVDLDVTPATTNSPEVRTYTTTINTVPVGFVMSVTPQIDEADTVILNVRPSITRVTGYVRDPNPELARAQVTSLVPEIQTREMESVMKIDNGEVAVMGGLMQDSVDRRTDGVPGLASLPGIGALFRYRNDVSRKSELVVFLRPQVLRSGSLAEGSRHWGPSLAAGDSAANGGEWGGTGMGDGGERQ